MTVRSSAATPSPAIAVLPDVIALLEAPLRLRDKLIRGLMYATRMRVSEVARVRWRDVDFDRNVIKVWQGKGRSDRQVMLSECFDRMPESKQAVPPPLLTIAAKSRTLRTGRPPRIRQPSR